MRSAWAWARNDPIDAGDLKYVYEKSLVALPTQAVTLGRRRDAARASGVRHQLPNAAACRTDAADAQAAAGGRHGASARSSIDEIYDKGASKGAIMYMTRKLFDAVVAAICW